MAEAFKATGRSRCRGLFLIVAMLSLTAFSGSLLALPVEALFKRVLGLLLFGLLHVALLSSVSLDGIGE
jgi:hypothetical protein